MPTKNILPSSKFAIIIAIVASVTLGGIVLSSYFGSHSSFTTDSSPLKKGITLEDAITRDSNKNGTADWEESLWGLDPKENGLKNKAIIEQKKTAAGITPVAESDMVVPGTPTAQFSKGLLASILALKENGSLTQEAIENLGNSIGQDIDSRRNTTATYTAADMSIQITTAASRLAYYASVKALMARYAKSGIGTEFEPLATAITDESNIATLAQLTVIAKDYDQFAKDLIALPTPADAAPYALNLANASAANGMALVKISTLYTDALTGMVGLDEYTVADTAFESASTELLAYFKVTHQ